jgi:DNA-binding transcriptional LysR family regulator
MTPTAFKQLRFQQLRSFCEAARSGSFARAAGALGISRPAVWQQIRALERELGAPFLVRRGNRLELTREGRLLADLAAPLVSGFDSIKTAFERRRGEGTRRLVVATTSGLLAQPLREPVRAFRRRHPDVQLSFLDRVSAEAVQLVVDGKAALGLVGHLEEEPRHPALDTEALASVPFRAVFPPGHPLSRARRLGLRELLRHPLVLMARGSRARARVDRVLRELGAERDLRLAMDTTNALMVLEYVRSGMGVGVATFVTEAAARWRLESRDLSRLFGRERIVLVRRKSAERDATSEAFRAILKETLGPGA